MTNKANKIAGRNKSHRYGAAGPGRAKKTASRQARRAATRQTRREAAP